MTRVLGIDLGTKRTGIAICDELRLTIRPLPIWHNKNLVADVTHILELCLTNEVADVVIGYPVLPQSGDEGMMAKRVKKFAGALQEASKNANLTCQIHLVDEMHSSKDAGRRLALLGVKKSKRAESLDAEVACELVAEFLAVQPKFG